MNRISVVIPVYQGERHLAQAVQSVLEQSYPATEIIVVNDGSTDGTEAIAARFGNAIRYVAQENGGISAARNRGLELAEMEWISFLDADDVWQPNKLALQMAAFDAALPDMVFGHVRQFIDPSLPPELKARIACPDTPVPGIFAGTLLMRRETFLRVGLFDLRWRTGEFIDWYLRAQEIGLTSRVLPEVILHRRLHASNHGIRERESRSDMLYILKASLNRRRGAPSSSE
jgi:glycosyltransferase involved in cell wall biosynthesis